MIRAYKLEHSINIQKQEKIFELFSSYRKLSQKISQVQWNNFFKSKKFDKNLDIKTLKTPLSARYKQVSQYQVVGQLQSYLANRQNDFRDIVYKSNLEEATKKELFYINKSKKWFCNEIMIKKIEVSQEIIFLSRKIFKKILKKNKKPNLNYCNLALDEKVAKIESKEEDKASKFDYWVKLSTIEKGKPILLPIKAHKFFNDKRGTVKKFVQFNLTQENILEVVLLKALEKENYRPKTEKIALDLGLNTLFASNYGDMFGRGFSKLIKKYDGFITLLAKNRQKQKLKTASKRYKKLVSKLKNYLKNEINRVINRIIKIHKPKEIIVERLNFQSPKLSKKLNRILSNFGKSIITQKFKNIEEEFGIVVTEINPAYTSQECSKCGYVAKNNRKSQKDFTCGFCKQKQNADVNASRVLLSRSSTKLAKHYLHRAFILDKLVNKFIERHLCHNSLANILALSNPYFSKVKLLQ
jgi:putative transposase